MNDNISNILDVINKVTPDFTEILEKRYSLLKIIQYFGPIGRRSISNKIGLSERIIRTEANILKDQEIIKISSEGMILTPIGETTIEKMDIIFHDLKGLRDLEVKLRKLLGIKDVEIISSSVDNPTLVYKEIGKKAAKHLKTLVKEGSILGLTGGTTISYVVEEYDKSSMNLGGVTIIPARGGLGKKMEFQANTLVERLSRKMNSKYKTLYTPDNLSQDAIDSLKNEPSIKKIIKLIDEIDVLLFGIGRADSMAKRRGLSDSEVKNLVKEGAVAEGFGYYFDKSGEIVFEISTIGIDLEKYKSLKDVLAVAAGSSKAEAIMSISKLNNNLVLVTDESAAKQIISNYKEEY